MRNHRHLYTYQEFNEAVEAAEWVPCREVPELFFPDDFPVGKLRTEASRMAKNLCQECPIITECLLYAVAKKETYGVWGGTLPNER